uniref:UAS domain-containing protein n=1 Tax=Globodera rostochiensis TaxID=31243 RepID=A0A914HXE7_GLORO
MGSEKALQSFKEFTGFTDDDQARRLLSKYGWNVERAIDIFFSGRNWAEEEGEVMLEDQPTSSQARHRISHFANSPWTVGEASNGSSRADEPMYKRRTAKLDDSVQILDDNDVQMVEESDRRGVGKTENGAAVPAASEGVRAPIAPVQGVLIDQSFRETYQNRNRLWNSVFEQHRHDAQPSTFFSRASHRAAAISGPNMRPDLGEEVIVRPTGRAPPLPMVAQPNQNDESRPANSQHRKVLQSIFRPPVELMFQGDWDQALQAARQKGVWLLVNVQEASEFACAVLNRDIWSAETVREVVRPNFLFWQVYHDSADGARIRGYYGLTSFPAIFIVDPRTGEEVSGRLKALEPVSFLDSLTSFLDQNPTFEARDRLIRSRASANNSNCLHATSPSSTNRTITTPTKKRKQPGSESSSGLDDYEQPTTEGDEEMTRQAKKIKRVVTITDGGISYAHRPSPSVATASTETLLDPNEWRHWTLSGDQSNKSAGVSGRARVVQLLLRLPDGRGERVRMWMAAPLSALFSLLLSMGVAPVDHQLVLDYPRPGFGVQEVVHVDRIKP